MCQQEINSPEPSPARFVAIDELVVDQMQWLGLTHFIGILTGECMTEPRPGPSRFKRPVTPSSSDIEEVPPDEEEQAADLDSAGPAEWDTQRSGIEEASQQTYIP